MNTQPKIFRESDGREPYVGGFDALVKGQINKKSDLTYASTETLTKQPSEMESMISRINDNISLIESTTDGIGISVNELMRFEEEKNESQDCNKSDNSSILGKLSEINSRLSRLYGTTAKIKNHLNKIV